MSEVRTVGRLASPEPWSVQARNLPEHAGNPIHTDEGARAAGFDAALVAGVTVYAYLTRPAAAAWGLEWVRRGAAAVSFSAPVQAVDRVDCLPRPVGDHWEIEASVDGAPRAVAEVWRAAPRAVNSARPLHVPLAPYEVVLDGEWDRYGARAGEDLELYDVEGIVHPAVWPALANRMMSRHLVRGSWIHTRSHIEHHDVGPVGATALVDPVLVNRFATRAGHRAVLDVTISVNGRVVATLEHEAVVELVEPSS